MAVANFTLAVDRRFKKDGEQTADFIQCVAFGKLGEHVEKYYRKGLKVAITGHIQTGSYVNKEGRKTYTTKVVADELEFAESKAATRMKIQASSHTAMDLNRLEMMRVFLSPERSLLGDTDKP